MRITWNTFIYTFFLLLSLASQQHIHAQCTTTINTFPYNEGFETNNGNWTASSSAHWEWGTPVGKTVILNAGGGLKCWIAGGLTGSAYNSGSSELISPCFDLSSLSYPEISFKVFWETELNYDGATIQYSVDAGSSWSTLGAPNSNDPCLGIENWFNYASVNFLGSSPGWSGNVQTGGGQCLSGQGSGQWLTAKHNLSGLTGLSNVKFKFVFGAGTICNGYDGFAIDDIHIGEAAANAAADFTYTCGANNSAQFNNISLLCQTGWAWDFGDVGSGQDNYSTAENPAHTFSSPGTYNVSLFAYYGWGPPSNVPPKTIKIINVTAATTNIKCNGDQNGAITLNVNPPGTYNYSWDTNPVQTTATISNLGPAVYTVTVTATNTCNVSVPVTLINPAVLTINPVPTPAKCGNTNGTITANAAGGTVPYLYTWSNGQVTPVINNLPAGTYGLSVKDVNGCVAPAVNNITVQAVTYTVSVFLGKDTTICPGQTLILRPGTFASYQWQDNSTAPTFTVTKTGTYTVQVTDIYGCSGSATIKVIVDCKGIFFPSAFTPNSDAINPTFGALGDLGSLTDYNLTVYNRYAEVIFNSTDPFKKWDGTYKGMPQGNQCFVWTAKYTARGQSPVFKKGTVIIIR